VRQDLSLAQQLVQSNHATYHMAVNHPHYDKTAIPSIVLIGVPNKKALERVITKLKTFDIPHTPFYEPDWEMGLSAVATSPNISDYQRSQLLNYSIWREPNSQKSSTVRPKHNGGTNEDNRASRERMLPGVGCAA
jgi:hypothetical protein